MSNSASSSHSFSGSVVDENSSEKQQGEFDHQVDIEATETRQSVMRQVPPATEKDEADTVVITVQETAPKKSPKESKHIESNQPTEQKSVEAPVVSTEKQQVASSSTSSSNNAPEFDYKKLWEDAIHENQFLKGQIKVLKAKTTSVKPKPVAASSEPVDNGSAGTKDASLENDSSGSSDSRLRVVTSDVSGQSEGVNITQPSDEAIVVDTALSTEPVVVEPTTSSAKISAIQPNSSAIPKKLDEIGRFHEMQDGVIPNLREHVFSDQEVVYDLDTDVDLEDPDELKGL
jgi:hypothetical protein